MKKIFLAWFLGLGLSSSFASDIITDRAAQELFKSLFDKGGDIYCTSNQCSLVGHCVFDQNTGDGIKFKCEINKEVQLSAEESESLFRDIFNLSLTMDTKCSAHYCELTSMCEYSRLIHSHSKYKCEIF